MICDDDKIFLNRLKTEILALKEEYVNQIELFSDVRQFEFFIAERPNEENIVIMDVRLGHTNGIDLAGRILELQPNSQIIFTSGYDSYYLDVYSVEHVYFLKKPVDPELLRKAIRRAGEKMQTFHTQCLMVSNREGIHSIPYNEILYLENELRKVHIYKTAKGEGPSFYGKLEDVLQSLDDRFIRCHNSYIVNITKVKSLSNRKFYFDGGRNVPISRTYYNEVRKTFLQYMSREVQKHE